MTQENKELLLKDLSARLPYGVICYGVTNDTDEDGNYTSKEVTNILYELHRYKCCYGLVGLMNECDIESIKPYLRPMSSMTEEEHEELLEKVQKDWSIDIDKFGDLYFDIGDACYPDIDLFLDIIDWLNKHHFDYRGLIKKGLAIEAPEGMYK